MSLEKTLNLKGITNRYPIVQGGMGVGISLLDLAAGVGQSGGIGTVSSAALDQLTAKRIGVDKLSIIEATEREISDTKEAAGVAAINIMVAVFNNYEDSVEGAVRGGVDMIISGAGLPMKLPSIVEGITGTNDHEVALVPIVSSARALELIIKRWDKQGYRPDAVVLEGPKAGGHLGWNYKQVLEAGDRFLEEYDLFDVLLDPVLDVANKNPNDFGPIPIIVAGGVYSHEDILYSLDRGAAAVQMGTRFAVTEESSGSDVFKRTLVEATEEDILIGDKRWGSPCGLPFRYARNSPLAKKVAGYDEETMEKVGPYMCICTTLLKTSGIDNSDKLGTKGWNKGCPEEYVRHGKKLCPATGKSTDYLELATCGTNASRVDRIMPVSELMDELIG